MFVFFFSHRVSKSVIYIDQVPKSYEERDSVDDRLTDNNVGWNALLLRVAATEPTSKQGTVDYINSTRPIIWAFNSN